MFRLSQPAPRLFLVVSVSLCCGPVSNIGRAQDQTPHAETISHELIVGATVDRSGTRLVLHPEGPGESGSVTIPRMYASLRSAHWHHDVEHAVNVHPEPEHWVVSWKSKPDGAASIVLEFDVVPLLESERPAVIASGDGSLLLHAHQAVTSGEKLRYEPQSFKNTVGYWVNPDDFATWTIEVGEPGEFNIGILQGCGKGQGGSLASISLLREDNTVAAVEFDVLETGHFQNFQWRTVGQLAIEEPGTYSLRIAPKQIARNALMDVRAIHLVRLPAPKK